MLSRSKLARIMAVVAAALVLACAQQAAAIRPCPPDIDCSGAVNTSDLLSVINSWGPVSPGNPSDVDGSGVVNAADLLAVINGWGPCVFDLGPQFPNAEAFQIALEGANGLLASPEIYERIDRDLGLIRAAYPALADQFHTPAWIPNQLIVGVYNLMPLDGFNCLNTFYQADVKLLYIGDVTDVYVITLAGNVNTPQLGPIYVNAPEVVYAWPNNLVGGENFWTFEASPSDNWQWDVDDGFNDCFDGCDCHRYYRFYTYPDGTVTLVNYTEEGAPWCVFDEK